MSARRTASAWFALPRVRMTTERSRRKPPLSYAVHGVGSTSMGRYRGVATRSTNSAAVGECSSSGAAMTTPTCCLARGRTVVCDSAGSPVSTETATRSTSRSTNEPVLTRTACGQSVPSDVDKTRRARWFTTRADLDRSSVRKSNPRGSSDDHDAGPASAVEDDDDDARPPGDPSSASSSFSGEAGAASRAAPRARSRFLCSRRRAASFLRNSFKRTSATIDSPMPCVITLYAAPASPAFIAMPTAVCRPMTASCSGGSSSSSGP
mmetsp:Transcript_23904/g.94826  ORF Transcript_23904/g.94826 Transcript_23904/m.94826 type:complete len:265 (-) Transcript_23904:220-1014(-)